jgi:glycosyltransferase involved in cell wall biosynthesis
MKPRVTVLTTVYNGLPYLSEAIESILNQTYTNFEFLIIDDASTDASVECIKSYKDHRIRLVRNENNLGTSGNMNRGLSLIETPYVVRLDQDDVSLSKRIEEQIAYLEKHPDIAIVCSWEQTIDSNGRKIRDWKRAIRNYGDFLGTVLLGLCPIWHPSIAFKKEVMIDAGGFNAEYARAEDFEVTTRIALKRYDAAIVPRFHVLQREHNNRQSMLYDNRQANVARRVHNETVNRFCSHSDANCLAALLRLEKDPCGKAYNRKHIKDIMMALNQLISNVRDKQKINPDEMKSLEDTIYRRVGFGVRYGAKLTRLPSILFYPTFYSLSPLLIPGVRRTLSGVYSKLQELRYPINCFNKLKERNS